MESLPPKFRPVARWSARKSSLPLRLGCLFVFMMICFYGLPGNLNDVSRDEIVSSGEIVSSDVRKQLLQSGIESLRTAISEHNPEKMYSAVDALNRLPVANADRFELLRNSIPLLLLVHKRKEYLAVLVEQLRNNRRIHETLLIVVHDGVFDPVVDIISRIDFCQVKQIFTPYSWVLQKEVGDPISLRMGSNSLKLNWLWAQHQVFEIIQPQASHVSYIEDDFWVTSDYYLTLLETRDVIDGKYRNLFPGGFTVGGRPESFEDRPEPDFRISLSHNWQTGWAMSREHWDSLKLGRDLFCEHPSQNYDYTISSLWLHGVGSRWILATTPRLVHAGRCGGFHFTTDPSNSNCNITGQAQAFQAWPAPTENRTWTLNLDTVTKATADSSQSALGYASSRDEGHWVNDTLITVCKSIVEDFH